MAPPSVVLFDFFGTLVTYEADRTALRYDATHRLLAGWGCVLSHDEFVAVWDAASTEVETASGPALRETTMVDAARAFGERANVVLDDDRRRELIEVFLEEWAAPVRPVPGAAGMLERLSSTARLGVVSNTNDPHMVPRLLDRFEMSPAVEHVVLSVDHGWRKPHPSIYAAALDRFGCRPADVLFVGDTDDADFHGPREMGMAALLIDPGRRHDVPEESRLATVLELEQRLRVA